MKKIIRKILKESDFDWVEKIPEAGTFNGRVQGVVYIKSVEELLLFNELINKNNDTETLTQEHLGEYWTVLDNSEEFCGQTVMSLSFFIEKNDKYHVGYWDCMVDEDTVEDWLVNDDMHELFISIEPNTWQVYDNIHTLVSLF